MGNKGSKGGRSMRPPIKSDARGFKFGGHANGGRDAGVSAPAAPSYPPQGYVAQSGGQFQQYHQQQPPKAASQQAPASSGDEAECALLFNSSGVERRGN